MKLYSLILVNDCACVLLNFSRIVRHPRVRRMKVCSFSERASLFLTPFLKYF